MIEASTTHVVELGDGNTTHVTIWGERGPVLLCVHGITSSRQAWRRTADFFADHYRVVAYDQRGHGDSAGVRGPMTLERSLRDLDAVVATVDGPIRALIGHSWGGAVAVLGGRRIACERVVAIDPMLHQAPGMWAADFVDDVREVLAIDPAQREPHLRRMFASLADIEIDAKVHAMRTMEIGAIERLGAENDADTGGWDIREALRAYPKRLYLPVAQEGESVISAADLATVREIAGPHVTIEVYEGAGHALQRTDFAKFAAATAAFLESEVPARVE